MKIAQVAPLRESIPRFSCGPERVASYLADELLRLGHEVTLFAAGDPQNAKLTSPDVSCFDVVHFHCDDLLFPPPRRSACPTITTLHGWPHAPGAGPPLAEYCAVPLVSVCNAQRRAAPEARWLATVYPGLPRDLHFLRERPGGYLAFFGSMFPEDRLDRAAEIARGAGMKLRIAAANHLDERAYLAQAIDPLPRRSRRWIEFVGEVGGREKDEFLGNARVLVHPVDRPEPFGLVVIEAMACGTPVIGWRSEAVTEVIAEGVTGFVVDSVEEAVRAVGRVADLNRRACRERFKHCFDASRMALDYLHLYRQATLAASE